MKMKPEVLRRAIAELTKLSQEPIININGERVKNSIFYSAIQEETTLDLFIYPGPKLVINKLTMLLLVEVVTMTSSIHTINLSNHQLAKDGPEIAKALAMITSLHTLNISSNKLGKYGPEVAVYLASSKSLHVLNISDNQLGSYGPETAKALAKSQSLNSIYMSSNALCSYGPETAEALSSIPLLYTVKMIFNHLNEYGPAVAVAFSKSKMLHTINMSYNNLQSYEIETVAAFDKSQSLHTIHLDNGLSDNVLSSITRIETRNIESFKNFVKKLSTNSEMLYLPDLNYLKYVDKNLLTKHIENRVDLVAMLNNGYFPKKYFYYNAFEIVGICKDLTYSKNSSNTETGLYDMPAEIISFINSFLSPEDYTLSAVEIVGNPEELTSDEFCLAQYQYLNELN